MSDYAVIELGGKQYRVEKGDSVLVDRIDGKEGSKLSPRAVFCRSGDKTVMDGDDLGKVKVEAVIAEHLRGEKVRVFTYRAKKRSRRRAGHRSALTRLEISDIKLGERKRAAATQAETGAKPSEKAEGARRQPAKKEEAAGGEAKKPARKPAARKPTAKKDETKG
jgi:large subunit ribosomal protein L21